MDDSEYAMQQNREIRKGRIVSVKDGRPNIWPVTV
jgi:hypothetical protein